MPENNAIRGRDYLLSPQPSSFHPELFVPALFVEPVDPLAGAAVVPEDEPVAQSVFDEVAGADDVPVPEAGEPVAWSVLDEPDAVAAVPPAGSLAAGAGAGDGSGEAAGAVCEPQFDDDDDEPE